MSIRKIIIIIILCIFINKSTSDYLDYLSLYIPSLVKLTFESYIDNLKENNYSFYIQNKNFINILLSEFDILIERTSLEDKLEIINDIQNLIKEKIEKNGENYLNEITEIKEIISLLNNTLNEYKDYYIQQIMNSTILDDYKNNYTNIENFINTYLYNNTYNISKDKFDINILNLLNISDIDIKDKESLQNLINILEKNKHLDNSDLIINVTEKDNRIIFSKNERLLKFDSKFIDIFMIIIILTLTIFLIYYGYIIITDQKINSICKNDKFIKNEKIQKRFSISTMSEMEILSKNNN